MQNAHLEVLCKENKESALSMQIFNDVAQFYQCTKTHSFSRFWRKLSKLGLIKVQCFDPVVELG